jgi:basic membrane protein A
LSKGLKLAVVLATGALALTACGNKPADTASSSASTSGSTSASASTVAYKACMVTDTGGIDDRSFNASAWKGMQTAQSELGVQVKYLASKAESDYTPNINALVQEKCDLIVTVGFAMGDATTKAGLANPSTKFAIIDNSADPKTTNVKGLEFNTAQPAFMAGYLAAAQSKTGKVGTFGGMQFPTVAIFMDGFAEGVAYYNKAKGKSVQVLGWDEKTQKGSFAGSFTDKAKGSALGTALIQQGADIIFPVAGGTGLGAAAVAQSSKKALVIWVDQDGYISAPQIKDVVLSTVEKGVDASVAAAIKDGQAGTFTNKPYIGTLENGGVLLAPFHDLDSQVSAETKSELDAIKADIISGKIVIASVNQPTS